jgi:hypothetical protein
MDPVGFAASLLTLAAAANGLGKLVKTARDAPAEFRDLLREIDNLSAVISSAEQLDQENKLRMHSTCDFASILVSGRERLDDLSTFVGKIGQASDLGNPAVSRLQWLFRKNQGSALRENLKDLRMSIAAIAATSNALVSESF